MRTDAGWSLVELLVVIGILALLMAILVPAVDHVRNMARLATCGGQMHDLHAAIRSRATAHNQQLPPFVFSDASKTNISLSAHWGGASQAGDPAAFGRRGVDYVNLWVLVRDGFVPPAELICPAAAAPRGRSSYFPYSFRFSTYCLRMPASADLFRQAPVTWQRYGMRIYALAAGGQPSPVRIANPFGATACETVPLVRVDGWYRLIEGVACGDGNYEPATDAMLADAFWRQDHRYQAQDRAGLLAYHVESAWCHGKRFNVLSGGGAVRTVIDDGTVRSNTVAPGGELPDDGMHFATYAERVWQFFDVN
ncbi:MAG: type II secretion system protein [Planctomycetota bacterium]|jgi:type II secretory pathway pseudopilin PulG